jgi:transcriptional regulator with PAS, ATPase and Fis domain
MVFSEGQPCLVTGRLNAPFIDIGRQDDLAIVLRDSAVSRVHTRVAHAEGVWTVSDLGSRNGTFVDGERLDRPAVGPDLRVLRIGGAVLLLRHDIGAYAVSGVECSEGRVVGPILSEPIERTRRVAKAGQGLHLTGETGVGKEIFARVYHEASPHADGPFVAVNCATIPRELAESSLFGAKRGSYTGAHADQQGLFRAANGGTLFLDELGELDLSLQAKLLRVLELREVVPVGSTQAQPVRVQVCSATLGDLRELVRLGKFREDLYFRIARPAVSIPPLRERLEEVPWLMQEATKAVSAALQLTPTLVETCLGRSWPGNVRELLTAIRDAAYEAVEAGSNSIKVSHLDPGAGISFDASPMIPSLPMGSISSNAPSPKDEQSELRVRVEDVLRKTAGNVSRAARALGWHRTQLRRYLDREGIEAEAFTVIDRGS